MQFFEAFDQTLKEFEIKNTDLQELSGVTTAAISRFRRGERDIHSSTLYRLVSALPLRVQQHYYMTCLTKDMDDTTMAAMLIAIAARMRMTAEAKADEEATDYKDDRIPA
jgi:predicted transcriptional regulator